MLIKNNREHIKLFIDSLYDLYNINFLFDNQRYIWVYFIFPLYIIFIFIIGLFLSEFYSIIILSIISIIPFFTVFYVILIDFVRSSIIKYNKNSTIKDITVNLKNIKNNILQDFDLDKNLEYIPNDQLSNQYIEYFKNNLAFKIYHYLLPSKSKKIHDKNLNRIKLYFIIRNCKIEEKYLVNVIDWKNKKFDVSKFKNTYIYNMILKNNKDLDILIEDELNNYILTNYKENIDYIIQQHNDNL